MKKALSLFLFISFFILSASAQRTSPIGKWKTVDDNTGKVKSTVEIYEEGGKLFGKVLELFDPEKPDPVCEECDDEITEDRSQSQALGNWHGDDRCSQVNKRL